MKNLTLDRFPLLVPIAFSVLVASCESGEKTAAAPVVQDTMLLHDLAQANRNTAAADLDTTIPVIVRSRTDEGDVIGSGPENARDILTPSGTMPRMTTPRRPPPASATTPRDTPRPAIAATGDPCDSPAGDDQRTCLYRAIARSDVNLNRVYQELIAQARQSGGPELEERFRERQRAWIITRDQECRQQTRDEEGQLWARVRARCLGEYSARRTNELQESLNSLRGR